MNKKLTLKQHIKKNLLLYSLGLFALLSSVAVSMITPRINLHIVDDVIVGRDLERLWPLLLALLGCGVARMILQYCKEYSFDCASANVASKLRRDLFVHIQGLDTAYFDKTNTGEIMARLKDDIDKVWGALSYIGMLLIEVTLHTIMILYSMFRLNAFVTIIPVIAMVFCGYLAIYMEKKLGPIYEAISDEDAVLTTTAEENIGGVRTVRAFAREQFEIGKFIKHNDRYCELNVKQSLAFVKYYPYFQFVSKIVPLLTIVLCGYFYINGNMTLGTITAFMSYSGNIVWPMEMLGWLTNEFSSAIASIKKINKIYDEVSTINNPESPADFEKVKGDIEFYHVGFHKEDQYEIIKDVSFHVPCGHTLGIMGATGAGKTSIVQLLTRLYDVTSGEIRIDGVNIKDLNVKDLRGNISLVMQDVFLFSDTISENIKMGAKNYVTSKEIVSAARKAGASEFIEKMEDKYDTVIGERGVGLSGGQKQRISIARAFAKKLPILILDDSTSALDMETEKEIQTRLNDLNDMTKIIIAHRISSVKKADEIIVLDDGRIAERGTHDELLSKHGLYYETYVSQFGEPALKGGAALCQ